MEENSRFLCRKHEKKVDVSSGEGCPDPENPCKYRSECIIHAFMLDREGSGEEPGGKDEGGE